MLDTAPGPEDEQDIALDKCSLSSFVLDTTPGPTDTAGARTHLWSNRQCKQHQIRRKTYLHPLREVSWMEEQAHELEGDGDGAIYYGTA